MMPCDMQTEDLMGPEALVSNGTQHCPGPEVYVTRKQFQEILWASVCEQ